jgi:hypothetical protein
MCHCFSRVKPESWYFEYPQLVGPSRSQGELRRSGLDSPSKKVYLKGNGLWIRSTIDPPDARRCIEKVISNSVLKRVADGCFPGMPGLP